MDADQLHEVVAQAIRRLDETQRANDRDVAELKAQLAALVDLLVARGSLVEGHRKHLGVVARSADDGRRKIRLRQYVDKYTMETAEPIDCGALIPLCKGRCCSLTIELTTQDIEEGKVRWDINEPYVLRKDPDGYCTHQDRTTRFCTVYEHRPATCRAFDCRHDRRIWLDFDKKIPAPF